MSVPTIGGEFGIDRCDEVAQRVDERIDLEEAAPFLRTQVRGPQCDGLGYDAGRHHGSGGRIETWGGLLTGQLPSPGSEEVGIVLGQDVLDGERHREEDVHRIQNEHGGGHATLVHPFFGDETFGQGPQGVALAASPLAHDVEYVGAPYVHPDVAVARFGMLADEDRVRVVRRRVLADQQPIVRHRIASQCGQGAVFVWQAKTDVGDCFDG